MGLAAPHINLKGFIVANGATDYNTDPYISSIEIANAFDLIPNDFFQKYQEYGCRIYSWYFKIEGPDPCPEMIQWLFKRSKEANVYQLRIP